MPNRLAQETSPYLLQHQNNPVDWHPWGTEALTRAKAEQKPILVSIGYSACHWCHVMEHESFENAEIARQMNAGFVCIKVDREERPDLDHIYMSAVQVLTRRGGWPLNVFLTPDLKPFYGGTYWPPEDRHGMPGFPRILNAVLDAWTNRRDQAQAQAEELTQHLGRFDLAGAENSGQLRLDLLRDAGGELEQAFDFTWGGFGGAPKFPHAMDLQLLMRIWRRERRSGLLDMVRITLDRMYRGGIYDHLGGGFARYSVDERWLVPHFEKMLYDNALLAATYGEFHQITGEELYARVARETSDYILRDMTDPTGGFHSAEDADSEGEEGKFYVWSPAEIRELLGPEKAERFCYVYDVTKQGNFEGHSILNLPKTVAQSASLKGWDLKQLEEELAASRAVLYAARDKRIHPGKDDKVLTAWNGLMLDALARVGTALNEPRYLAAATKAAEFIWNNMRRADGRLLRAWRAGKAKYDAYLDDYAGLANGLVSLYEATFDERWIDAAAELADVMLQHFADPAGGFFFTADDHEELITRHKDLQDGSVPSGNSLAATVLLRLGKLTGREDYLTAAESTLKAGLTLMERAPLAAGQMLLALDFYLGPTQELALIGPASEEMTAVQRAIFGRYYPNRVLAWRDAESNSFKSSQLDPLFAGKEAGDSPTLYVCEQFACQAPASGVASIRTRLDELAPR